MAQLLAALILKVCKCHITPLAGAFTPELAARYAAAVASLVPAWADFVVVPNLKYLGMWVGPNAYLKSWMAPRNKYRHRSNMLSGANAPTAVTANLYSARCATTL
eukprot:2394596-Pyramimonas_sp.AAC.1